MNSPLKSRRNAREANRRRTIIFVVAALIIGLSVYFGIAGKIFNVIGRPLWNTQSRIGLFFTNIRAYFSERNTLLAENEALRGQIFERDVKLVALLPLREENTSLKEALGRFEKRKPILVPVLRGPGYSPYDTFLVDGGSDQGIKVGDTVSIDTLIAVGKIEEVQGNTSLVRLFSSPGNELVVHIDGVKAQAKAIGRGNGNFEITLPRDVEVAVGAAVTLPGISSETLGTIQNIEADVVQSFQTLLFALPLDIQGLKYLYVEPGTRSTK